MAVTKVWLDDKEPPVEIVTIEFNNELGGHFPCVTIEYEGDLKDGICNTSSD